MNFTDVYYHDVTLTMEEHRRNEPLFFLSNPDVELTEDERAIRLTMALEMANAYIAMAYAVVDEMKPLDPKDVEYSVRVVWLLGYVRAANFAYNYMFPTIEGSLRFYVDMDFQVVTETIKF